MVTQRKDEGDSQVQLISKLYQVHGNGRRRTRGKHFPIQKTVIEGYIPPAVPHAADVA